MPKRIDVLNKLQQALISKYSQLAKGVMNIDDTVSSKTTSDDIADSATIDVHIQEAVGIKEFQGKELQKVRLALEQIKENNYGNCVDCETAIVLERMKALPYAIRCIDCSSKN